MGRRATIAGAIAMVLAVSACGESEEAESGSGSAPEASSGAQGKARDSLAKLSQPPTDIGIDEPLSKKPDGGKQIAVMNCGTPSCTAWAEAASEGVEAIGWTPRIIDQGTDPQKIGAAWNLAVRTQPDGVMNIGIPKAAITKPLAELAEANIPVVNATVGDKPGEGQIAILSGPETALPVGASQADAVVASAGADAHVLVHTSPEFPVTSVYGEGFRKRMAELCPDCPIEAIELSPAGAATGENVTKIVGYLRSHPDVNFVVGNDGVMVGLPNGLASANMADRVSVVGQSSGPTQFSYLKERSPANAAYKATSYFPPEETAWRGVDALARQFNGDSLDPTRAPVPFQVLTPENLPSDISDYFPIVDGYQDKFRALWKVQN